MQKYLKTLKTIVAQGYHPASAVEVIVNAFALSETEARRLITEAKKLAA